MKELLLDKYGVDFDQVDDGFSLAKEAAHSCSRVLHTRDQTGAAIMSTLFERVEKNSKITCRLGHSAVDLITLSHHSKKLTDLYSPSTCVGAYVLNHQSGCVDIFFAKETILATGGLGEVFLHTTNPKEAKGDGVAMAFRAGARIMNMEYVQFHPTALYVPTERRFLISEALRGEGAELLSNSMSPFMEKYPSLRKLSAAQCGCKSYVSRNALWIYPTSMARYQSLKIEIGFRRDFLLFTNTAFRKGSTLQNNRCL